MIALYLSFCFATALACHEQPAGTFPTFEACQDAAGKVQPVQFRGPVYDEQGAVLTSVTCRLIR